jgi:hypothetical protein
MKIRSVVQVFILSLPPDSYSWLFGNQVGQGSMAAVYTTWNNSHGYPFWHTFNYPGRVDWFADETTRQFLHEAIVDSSSDIWMDVMEAVPHRATFNYQKIAFALAWVRRIPLLTSFSLFSDYVLSSSSLNCEILPRGRRAMVVSHRIVSDRLRMRKRRS